MCTASLRCTIVADTIGQPVLDFYFLDFSQDPNGPTRRASHTRTIHKTTTLLRRRDGRDQTEQPERGKLLGRLGLGAGRLLGEEDERLARRRPDQP